MAPLVLVDEILREKKLVLPDSVKAFWFLFPLINTSAKLCYLGNPAWDQVPVDRTLCEQSSTPTQWVLKELRQDSVT